MPHEVKGRKKIITFLVEKLYRGNLLKSRNEAVVLRRNFLVKKAKLDYKSSYALEDYFNAILRDEPLPSHKLGRQTLDKLIRATPGIGDDLDYFFSVTYFFEEDFQLERFAPIRKEAILNRFDDALHAMSFLIQRSDFKRNIKGFIKGALMSYQIVQAEKEENLFTKIITSTPGISWDITIQDPESEIIDSLCNVTGIKQEVFQKIENEILKTISELEEPLIQHGGRINILKKENIIDPGLQGVFLGELCATLPSVVTLYSKELPRLDLRRIRDCHASFTKEIKKY